MKITSNSTQHRQKTKKVQKDKKNSFPKESLENPDLCKPCIQQNNKHTQIMRLIN